MKETETKSGGEARLQVTPKVPCTRLFAKDN